jgi:hypothetical protein
MSVPSYHILYPAVNWFFLKNIRNVYHSFPKLDTIIQILLHSATYFANFTFLSDLILRPTTAHDFHKHIFYILSAHHFTIFLPACLIACIILAARSAHRRFIKGSLDLSVLLLKNYHHYTDIYYFVNKKDNLCYLFLTFSLNHQLLRVGLLAHRQHPLFWILW